MANSIRNQAFQRMQYSDQGWMPTVTMVAGGYRWAVCMTKLDPCTGRTMYGQTLAIYQSRRRAETLMRQLTHHLIVRSRAADLHT